MDPLDWICSALVIIGGLLALLWAYLRTAPAALPLRGEAILGTVGRVTTPVPHRGIGTFAYTIEGRRSSRPCRGAGGQALPRGVAVRAIDIDGRIIVVERA